MSDFLMTSPGEGFRAVRTNIEQACIMAHRSNETVALVAVTKTHNIEAIKAVLVEGQRIFGENRVQEAAQKYPHLRETYPDLQLHLIGPLQTNKTKEAVALFDVIQTLDRPSLAAALAKEMRKQNRFLPCFVQINTGREEQKAGVLPEHADDFIEAARVAHGLNIVGLMCIPPVEQDPSHHFMYLATLAKKHNLKQLSMGMSGDFIAAIKAGATHVRVGTAIFGARPTLQSPAP